MQTILHLWKLELEKNIIQTLLLLLILNIIIQSLFTDKFSSNPVQKN